MTTRKRGRDGGNPDIVRLGARTVMGEREILINEFDELSWERKTLRDVFVTRGWGPICTLRGKIYPTMVREFYIGMATMPNDASSHTLIVRGVQFEFSADVIAELLQIQCILPKATAAQAGDTAAAFFPSIFEVDPAASASSSGPVEFMPSHEEDRPEGDPIAAEVGDDERDQDFYILTSTDRTKLDRSNSFKQN